MKIVLRIFIALIVLLGIAAGGFVIWGSSALPPMPEAIAALTSDSQVSVKTAPWLVFAPASGTAKAGYILYPGARVDPRAYAPAARAIAAKGYLVVIPPMPLNFAIFGVNKADEIIAAHPEITLWAVGGHSLGGAMAASYAKKNLSKVKGIIFLASYPASSDDLSKSNLKVSSIFGTLDGLATGAKIDASRPLLPADTAWVAIEGGDHAQFGWYGPQQGDNPATISRPAQTDQIVTAAVNLLASLGGAQ